MKSGVDKPGVVMKLYRAERYLYTHHMKVFAQIIFRSIYLLFNCYIPPTCALGDDVKMPHGIGIVIHQNATVGSGTKIYQNVTIGGGNHVVVGERCLLGANSIVIGNIHVGNDVKIGANTFVNFDVPDGATVVGQKARIIE